MKISKLLKNKPVLKRVVAKPHLIKDREFVIGIDPGTTHSGVALLSTEKEIIGFGKIPNSSLVILLEDILSCAEPAVAVIESIVAYRTIGNTTITTCVWSGVFHQVFKRTSVMVPRKTIVTALTGNPKANDSVVRMFVIDTLGEPGKASNPGPTFGLTKDCWQATGICLYGIDHVIPEQ